MAFNRTLFKREVLVFVFVALFIFLLSAFSLFSQTADFVMSLQTMETSAYMEYYDSNYDKNNDEQIKEAITRLENDETSALKKRIYVLDKGDSSLIATSSGMSSEVEKELFAQTNQNYIFIDFECCRAVDLDHYKILVQVGTFPIYQQFLDRVVGFAGKCLAILIVVLLVLFILRFKVLGDRRKVNIVVSSILMFCFVASFSLQALQTEMNELNYFVYQEKVSVTRDLDFVCNAEYTGKTDGLEYLDEIVKDLTNTSMSIQEIKLNNIESFKANGATSGYYDVAANLDITQSSESIQNKKIDLLLQAGLMWLLAFILVVELYAKSGASFIERQENKGIAPVRITRDDMRLKYLLFVAGIAMAGFSIINVLRIREVAMINWTGNVDLIISVIFTIALIAVLLGSFFSTAILKRCGNVKAYIIIVSCLGLVGATLCGSTDNPIVFVVGLVFTNFGTAAIKLTGDFYSTLIDDPERKDRCYVELDSGRSIGEVVGTIAGGVISVLVSYAFVQILVSVVFLIVILFTFGLKKSSLVVPKSDKGGIRESFSSLKNVFKHKNVALYLILVTATGSIPYMLLEYKLPLDIAALGLTAIVLSFIKVVSRLVEAYSKPLFHVINKRIDALDQAVYYRFFDAGILLFYLICGSMMGSLVGMAIAVILWGAFNGANAYAVTKAFRELPEVENIPESDRLAVYKVVCKAGDATAPTIYSVIQNPFVLAGLIFASPLVYMFATKRKKKCAS